MGDALTLESPSKTDLMYEILYNWDFVPYPSPNVNVKTTVSDEKSRYFMKNHVLQHLYELDKVSYDIWRIINGKRSMGDILEKMEKDFPDVQSMRVLQTVLFFAESGSLQAELEPPEKKRIRIDSTFKIHVVLVQSSKRFLGLIHRLVSPFLRLPLLWASLAFVGLFGILFAGQFMQILGDARNFEILGSTVVGLFAFNFVILAPVTAIHEIAHGLTVVHYGGSPKDMGTGWFYFGPMFYCDATDAWTFSRRHRIMVMLAGNLSTMLIGSFIMLAVYILPFSQVVSHMLSMTAFWCFYTSLWNFAPPFETDGYYVLSDALDMPNLRHDAYDYLKRVVKRVMRSPVEMPEDLTSKKKAILLGYAVMSVVWLAYMAFQSLTIMSYMAEDAGASVLKISSMVTASQALGIGALVVSLVSIGYFGMMVSGYAFLFGSAIKKAATRTMPFESIHDRDLSVFLYLPIKVPASLVNKLKNRLTKEAKKFTLNCNVRQVGPLLVAVLRLGGKKLAFVQIREHLKKMESAFSRMYQRFLETYKSNILESAGIYGQNKAKLTRLLKKMAKQSVATGTQEAWDVVEEALEDQVRDTIYLLNSACGKVWTIELPPAQQYEIQKSLLPTLLVEDLSITDLYDEVEDFKKRVIYGFDSLAKLAAESQTGLSKALETPEEYQVVASFQPVKGRVILVGRTERIEHNLSVFAPLFVDQAWCSYIDNLLSETNQMLFALAGTRLPENEEIQNLSHSELYVLDKNLSTLIASKDFVESSLKTLERHLESACENMDTLKKSLDKLAATKIGVIDAICAVNVENLRNLPNRFDNFTELSRKLHSEVEELKKAVKEERKKSKVLASKKKRRTLLLYPLFAVLSAIAAILGFSYAIHPLLLLLALALPQLAYLAVYALNWRSLHKLSRYPSWPFSQIHVFTFALTQALQKFTATADILTPTRTLEEVSTALPKIPQKKTSKNKKKK